MTVVFDAEPLLAFSFDEPGAAEVESWLDQIYDGKINGYVSTINLAEFRYIAARKTSVDEADAYIDALREMGVNTYDIDELWEAVSGLKTNYALSLGDAYALAAATELENDEQNVTLLVGADDDYNPFENNEGFNHLIARFRNDAA